MAGPYAIFIPIFQNGLLFSYLYPLILFSHRESIKADHDFTNHFTNHKAPIANVETVGEIVKVHQDFRAECRVLILLLGIFLKTLPGSNGYTRWSKFIRMTPSTISTTQVNFQKLKTTSLYHIMVLLKISNWKTSQLYIRVLELLGGHSIETETVTVEIIRVVKKLLMMIVKFLD